MRTRVYTVLYVNVPAGEEELKRLVGTLLGARNGFSVALIRWEDGSRVDAAVSVVGEDCVLVDKHEGYYHAH